MTWGAIRVAVYRIDLTGELCPLPVLKARMKLVRMQEDDVLVVITDHSCAMKSLPDQIRRLGYDVQVAKVAVGIWEVTIVKSPSRIPGPLKTS